MDNDLRSTLEAAVEEHTPEPVATESAPAPALVTADAPLAAQPSDHAAEPAALSSGEPVADPDKPKPITEVAGQESEQQEQPEQSKRELRVDRAPQSWKGEAKQVWAQLPLNVRQEVLRRERETTKVLQETAEDRNRLASIREVLAPHMDRINTVYGGNPIQAINNMLNVERIMLNGDPATKVQMVANMIKHFNIDVVSLDRVLSGQGGPTPEVAQQSALEQLLEQKLAPVQQFIQSQQQREAQQRAQVEQEIDHTIESMAANPEQFPYFEEVREDMADLIDLAAKKGVALSLEDAYHRAVRMNDGAYQASSVRESSQAATQAALQAHQQAQRAKGASLSVSGAPSTPGSGGPNPNDLRGTIESLLGGMGTRL
jgi:hypothetical protein